MFMTSALRASSGTPPVLPNANRMLALSSPRECFWLRWGERVPLGPALRDEWYRGPDWDEAAQEAFELRLRRARADSRQQYLRIKAVYLLEAGKEDEAVALLHRSIGLGTFLLDTVHSWEMLGDVAARHGRTDEAIGYYERILREQPSLSGTSGSVEISLARVLVATRERSNLELALTYLDSWMKRDGLKFNDVMFRCLLVLIEASDALGDHETVVRSARVALELASRGPQLPRHRSVGIVRTDELTLQRLKRLAE